MWADPSKATQGGRITFSRVSASFCEGRHLNPGTDQALADLGLERRGPSGYRSRVSMPIAVRVARLSRRGLCAAVALALSLTCIVFAVAASTTPMTDMVDMADASTTAAATAAHAAAVGAFTSGLTGGGIGDVVREAASPETSLMSLPMSLMCDTACVTDVSAMCTVAGGLTVTTLLALLLVSRRDTFMRLLARTRLCALPRRQRRQTPWTVLSPISLCVLRV